ncbi:DUF7504 family protein [Methanoplanus limicola]|uniref:KaiC-like domain-containing protein n=1 Tax=Methanoplanus limicola DSM 2279 TaxID=937775 RepID=H1YY76_9EURY|nr:hypothetical protein [Methanoplanus limicola]EHQ34171.1 hypothetical protein Metlim_0018 [Methanoplanus limicola DSM 2279]
MDIFETDPDEGRIYLILSEASHIKKNNVALIKELTDKNHRIIVITINEPASYLYELYKKGDVRLDKVSFIDAISKFAMGKKPEGVPNAVFVNNPSDLTGLSIAVSNELANVTEEKTYVLIDSVNAMLIYLSSENLAKFMHFVSSKLKILNISGIFLAIERGLDPIIISQLTSFSDDVIDMNGGER